MGGSGGIREMPTNPGPRSPDQPTTEPATAMNQSREGPQPLVGVIMGSRSDWDTMSGTSETLDSLGVPHETRIVSAHRTPDLLFEYSEAAEDRGLEVIVAGAGGAAHLPGMVASKTILPVLGVPIQSRALRGLDSLLSIVQMPGGVPVATVAIGQAKNAGLLAVQILATYDEALAARLAAFRVDEVERVEAMDLRVRGEAGGV